MFGVVILLVQLRQLFQQNLIQYKIEGQEKMFKLQISLQIEVKMLVSEV